MKLLSLTIVSLFICLFSFAQDISVLTHEGDRLELLPDEKAAFAKFKEVLKVQPNNLHALARCSEICSNMGNRETNAITRDAYFNTSLIYAKTAYKLYPESDVANVAMAIAVGRIVLRKSGKEKIVYVKDLKSYAEKAIAVNPKNFRGWHILGKWHYEVSNLSGLERTAAKIFFGALPASSFENAIYCYEKAKAINSTSLLNYLELAKAYKKKGDKTKAITHLTYLLTLKTMLEDDNRVKMEAQELLKKWK